MDRNVRVKTFIKEYDNCIHRMHIRSKKVQYSINIYNCKLLMRLTILYYIFRTFKIGFVFIASERNFKVS